MPCRQYALIYQSRMLILPVLLFVLLPFSLIVHPAQADKPGTTSDDEPVVINHEQADKADAENAALEWLQWLANGSFAEKQQAISVIAQQPSDAALQVLLAISDASLVYHPASGTFYRISNDQAQQLLEDFSWSATTATESADNYARIRINNSIRIQLRRQIARLQLTHSDVRVRVTAMGDMLRKLDDEALQQIAALRDQEESSRVQELMDIALATGAIHSDDEATALAAIQTLSESLEPVALNALRSVQAQSQNSRLRKAASQAIDSIEGKRRFFQNLETLYFGLSLGSVLVLAGIGLAITFGVMGVINMAHGELIMIGAYTTFVIQQLMPEFIHLSIIVAIPAAFLASATVGIAMERLVIRHLYGRPLETLLATFGISLILQQAVRSVFSPLNKAVVTPDWMSGLLHINSVFAITWNRLYIIGFCLAVFFALLLVMKKSALGLQVRAVSQNRMMARAMGVRSTRVDVLTFGLGAGIAGMAGVALSLLTNVGPNLGQAYIIDSFIVVVFGGVGNLWGTLLAGMSLGIANKLLEPWAGAVLAKIILLVFIVLFIQKRPQGLFPQRGRAVEH